MRRWWRQRQRRRRIAQGRRLTAGSLREFVYLDEVSVFSLASSLFGSVASEFTATQSQSLTGEVAGSVGGSVGPAGVASLNSKVESRLVTEEARGTQVLRKATIQATFKELHDDLKSSLLLRPVSTDLTTTNGADADITEALKGLSTEGWALAAPDLRRGGILEIDVELDADAIYQVRAFVETFLDLAREAPEKFGLTPEATREGAVIDALLGRLLAGLVPIRGHAANHKVVTVGGDEWIVHERALAEALPAGMQTRSLDIVAVAEARLFWKDLRRVLFSGARYTTLCRIGRDGLHRSWAPVKLVDVLRKVAPEPAEQLDSAFYDVLTSMSRTTSAMSGSGSEAPLSGALDHFTRETAKFHDLELSDDIVSDYISSVIGDWSDGRSVDELRKPFAALTQRMEKDLGITIDPSQAAELRTRLLDEAGLLPLSASASPVPETARLEHIELARGSDAWILDCEVIAIYW